MCTGYVGQGTFPYSLSLWWISGKLVLQISVISNNYHVRLVTIHKNAATNSSLMYDHKLEILKKSSPLLWWISQGLTDLCNLGRPQRMLYFSGDGKVSKKYIYSCQQLSETFRSSF